jgi:gliding motility-associated lipoprotein GldH
MMKWLFLSASLLFILSGCHPNRIYDKNKNLDDGLWHKDTVKAFTFEIEDKTLQYNLYGNLRNSMSYPYQNIYLQIEMESADGTKFFDELKNVNLFEPKTGKPLGDGLGDLFDHRILLKQNYTFPEAGNYRVMYQQKMREKELPYILSVGLMVEISGSNPE